jgi:ribose 1,5-bisphosphate isomerase
VQQLQEAADKIRRLEIQGATQVAMFAVKSLVEFAKRHSSEPRKELWNKLFDAEKILYGSRPTEPAMRNGLMYIIGKLLADERKGIFDTELAQMASIYGSEYESILGESKKKIGKYGSRLIPKDAEHYVVQTHCHSAVVEEILMEAKRQGKKFSVVATETRPFYQGRITAKKLLDAGIEVTQVVDSAMRWAARNLEADVIIIGADAITSEGTVLNKIGSRLLALVAAEEHIPLYVATPLLKYNPGTAFGYLEQIEMRDIAEIHRDWVNYPKNLKFLNPAFETVNRQYISGLITEAGIFPSGEVHSIFRETYRFLYDAYHESENRTI